MSEQMDPAVPLRTKVQRHLEDWWPMYLVVLIVGVIVMGFVTRSSSPGLECKASGGHIVQTGVGDQLACVDDNWKLIPQ